MYGDNEPHGQIGEWPVDRSQKLCRICGAQYPVPHKDWCGEPARLRALQMEAQEAELVAKPLNEPAPAQVFDDGMVLCEGCPDYRGCLSRRACQCEKREAAAERQDCQNEQLDRARQLHREATVTRAMTREEIVRDEISRRQKHGLCPVCGQDRGTHLTGCEVFDLVTELERWRLQYVHANDAAARMESLAIRQRHRIEALKEQIRTARAALTEE